MEKERNAIGNSCNKGLKRVKGRGNDRDKHWNNDNNPENKGDKYAPDGGVPKDQQAGMLNKYQSQKGRRKCL